MEYGKMLKEILASTHWTQEKLAAKLGVSFATVNYWLNGKTKPQKNAMKDIERLYLAQNLTDEDEPIYVTLVAIRPSRISLRVGDYISLIKDVDSEHDDEAIIVEQFYEQRSGGDEKGIVIDDVEDMDNIDDANEITVKVIDDSLRDVVLDEIYVANSVSTVVRGTRSAGRIYDRFDIKARAQVMFVYRNMAIARVISWGS